MPAGAPHYSFLVPYRIRVDDFSTPKDSPFETPACYLLSHTHSDHVTGLSAKSFGVRVVCSIDAKHMLLNMEPALDRIAFDNGTKTQKTRPYSHLKIDSVLTNNGTRKETYSRDLLNALPLHTPTPLELPGGVAVTLTLIDANHCPGAVMFLVEGSQGNFLHTGDVRAESSFLSSLARNPWLEKYIPPPTSFDNPGTANAGENRPLRTLDAIYLDTACLLSHTEAIPSKEDACNGLVELIARLPPLTRFFINSWTWGYEDILKAIGRAFNSLIHVDRYKHCVYMGGSDPFLKALLTLDPISTRFHACERWNRCEQVEDYAAGVVYINPVTMSKVKWDLYLSETRVRLERGEVVTNLLCPLSRHSHLPELQALVKLFRPKLVVPNSLNPTLGNLDWACMPRMFGEYMADGGEAAIFDDMRRANVHVGDLEQVVPTLDIEAVEEDGVEMKNLVGEGAKELVGRWAGAERAAGTKAQRMMSQMELYLGQRGPQLLADQLRSYASRQGRPFEGEDSDGDDDDKAEARGRAADTFFAPSSPASAVSSPGKARGLPSISPRSPISPKSLRSTTRRRISPQKSSIDSSKRFTISSFSLSSPSVVGPRDSPLSITSLSSPVHISPGSDDERAYHSLFDALQYQPGTSTCGFPVPFNLGKEPRHPNTSALTTQFASDHLLPAYDVSAPSSKQNEERTVPGLLFAAPSTTPSPHQTPLQRTPAQSAKVAGPITPVSGPTVALPRKPTKCPPMLDLCKMLKRTSSSAGLTGPQTKRRAVQVSTPDVSSSPLPSQHLIFERKATLYSATALPSVEGVPVHPRDNIADADNISSTSRSAPSLKPVEITRSTIPNPPAAPRSETEKARRRAAKEGQRRITEKLVRALPPDKVTPTCRAKVEKRERELRESHARQRDEVVAAKQGVARDCPPQECITGLATASGIQQEWTVVPDDIGIDWDKSREYEDGIRAQRREGVRYPQLPRLEKSFAESQSP